MARPVIVCGGTTAVGEVVIAGLKPEFDVIHFVMSAETGAQQIPEILNGGKSPASDSALGSRDYSRPPVAIILGSAFTDTMADTIMRASMGIRALPWLRPDTTKPHPPIGPEYGRALVVRIKALLAKLEEEGKMEEEKVHWY
ncbi:hypothetical protein LZ32DRAFT_609556 [Colletotrichum eremochloae]|nr:hypothetical protein LZ32DRAFT_609556 [Colletotrichum eremochloae]